MTTFEKALLAIRLFSPGELADHERASWARTLVEIRNLPEAQVEV